MPSPTIMISARLRRRRPAVRSRQSSRNWRSVEAGLQLPPGAFPPTSGEVEAIQVHDLVPGRHEVSHEPCRRIVLTIGLANRAELRVRTKNQVDTRACPPELVCLPVAPLICT